MTFNVAVVIFDSSGKIVHLDNVQFTPANQSKSIDSMYKFFWKPSLSNLIEKNYLPLVTKNYLVLYSFIQTYYFEGGTKIYDILPGSYFYLTSEYNYTVKNTDFRLHYTLQTAPGNVKITFTNRSVISEDLVVIGCLVFAFVVSIKYYGKKKEKES